MQQLKIIAVKPLTGCEPHIRKILKVNTTYFLYNDYEEDPENKEKIRKKKNYPEVPSDFFSINRKDDIPLINISAIVGKNGDGKSSVVELLMRILSNFAYASGYLEKHDYLFGVEGVFARLFYSIGNKIYIIENKGNEVRLLSEDWEDDKYKFDITKPLKESAKLKELEPFLFYTQISNYSLYAYNTRDFYKENTATNENWINGIFHKNDGYQTPIVLNPWREEGVIDINKENSLVKQRLTSLFVTDTDFRKINDKQDADSLVLTFSSSKLENKSLYLFFKDTMNSDISLHMEDKLNIKYLRNTIAHNAKNDKINYKNKFRQIISDLKRLTEFVKREKQLFGRAIDVKNRLINDIRKERNEPNWLPVETDIKKVFHTLSNIGNMLDNDDSYHLFIESEEVQIIQQLNAIQIIRCMVIVAFHEEWKSMYNNYVVDDTVKDLAYDYLIYKSISIVEKYQKYKDLRKDFYLIEFLTENTYFDNIQEYCKNIVNAILDDPSHISLKIRQTIHFIKLNNEYHYIATETDFNNCTHKEIKGKIATSSDSEVAIIKLHEYEKRTNNIIQNRKGIDILDLLPPPVFNVDILVGRKESEEVSLLSELSSGERQELNSISSVIYHLKNINSTEQIDKMIKYKYVNLIFEEIELYFHPEYQQKYVKKLISQIEAADLNNLESINICFVTHSPFILSDIPSNNILKIGQGWPILEKENGIVKEQTFGENIHELLANKFFLCDSFMGEFARHIIENLIEYLLTKDDRQDISNIAIPKTYWNPQKAKQTIRMVAEPVLQERLQFLYDKKFKWKDQEYIKERIEYLKSKLHNEDEKDID